MHPLNFLNDSVSDTWTQSDLHLQCSLFLLLLCHLSLSLSSISRCGSDRGECRPEAAGHGGGEEAKGEGAGGPGGTAEAVHRQEPDH